MINIIKNPIMFVVIQLTLISCVLEDQSDISSYQKIDFDYLLSELEAIEANQNTLEPTFQSGRKLILFLDASCQLCALDLNELKELMNAHLLSRGILPIAFLYNTPDPYISELIVNKDIFLYPIYYIDNRAFHNYTIKYDIYHDMYLIDVNNIVTYSGSPFKSNEDMARLSKIISN